MVETANVTTSELRGFSVRGLAKAYGVSAGLIRLEIARRRLKVAHIGRRIVIPVESVTEWLAAAGAGRERQGENRELA